MADCLPSFHARMHKCNTRAASAHLQLLVSLSCLKSRKETDMFLSDGCPFGWPSQLDTTKKLGLRFARRLGRLSRSPSSLSILLTT